MKSGSFGVTVDTVCVLLVGLGGAVRVSVGSG